MTAVLPRIWHAAALAIIALLALVASLVSGAANAAPAHRAATAHGAARDWTGTVSVVPGGGHLVGNPAAKVKLVEYISYTCPHCANFNAVTKAPLRDGYVRRGLVAVEIRNLVRDPIDLTVAMLTNCGDPHRFVANHDMFLATQEQWIAKVSGSSDEQRKRWDTGALPVRLKALAGDLGFYPMMAAHGYTTAQLDTCLADKAMLDRLIAETDGGAKAGVDSTPSFLVNGTLAAIHDWPSLEPMIKAAL